MENAAFVCYLIESFYKIDTKQICIGKSVLFLPKKNLLNAVFMLVSTHLIYFISRTPNKYHIINETTAEKKGGR